MPGVISSTGIAGEIDRNRRSAGPHASPSKREAVAVGDGHFRPTESSKKVYDTENLAVLHPGQLRRVHRVSVAGDSIGNVMEGGGKQSPLRLHGGVHNCVLLHSPWLSCEAYKEITMKYDYPEYPSVAATVEPSRYMDAIEALHGVRQVFCDGETILLPEFEEQAIEMLRSRFNASTVYGQAKAFEFATKARKAGVPVELLRLGHAVHNCTGQDAEEMVRAAIEQPSVTLLSWTSLYLSSMLPN